MAHSGSATGHCCHKPYHVATGHIRSATPRTAGKLVRQSRHISEQHGSRHQGRPSQTAVRAAHLQGREDLRDGSILFTFGDEPSSSASEDAQEQTQQTAENAESSQASPQAKQEEPIADSVQEQPASANGTQAQHTEQQESVTQESVDEEASDSDTASESLANMTPDMLEHMKVAELKSLCKQEQVKGYSKLKKDELVSLLQKQLQT